MSNAETKNQSSLGLLFWIFALCMGYAILRYHILGPVPWKDLSFYILNKGLCLTAYMMLIINFSLGPLNHMTGKIPKKWLNSRKALGMTAFLLALIHILMAMLLFSPSYYSQFFENNGTLTLLAGLSMFGGVISFAILWAYNLSFQTKLSEDKAFIAFITSSNFYLVGLLFGASHLFFMGYQGWLKPEGWHGGLPPISLVSFVGFVICFCLNLFGRETE